MEIFKILKDRWLLVELNEWIHKYVADDKIQEELNKWDLEIAENKGYEHGIEQRNVEIAQAMLESNVPVKDIAKYTGLLIEEIKSLKES